MHYIKRESSQLQRDQHVRVCVGDGGLGQAAERSQTGLPCPSLRRLPVKHVSFPPGPAPPLVRKAARDDNIYGERRQSEKRKEERKRQNEERGLEKHVIQGDVLLPEKVGW